MQLAPILLSMAVWAPCFCTAGDSKLSFEDQIEKLLKEGQAAKVLDILNDKKNQNSLAAAAQYRLKATRWPLAYCRKDW